MSTATLSISANTFTVTHDFDTAGTILLGNGAALVTGTAGSALGIFNSGTIKLNASSAATTWKVAATKLTLSGAGKVTLTANANNAIVSNGSAATFDNVDNLITGAGTIGDANLTLVNESAGIINANGNTKLTISTGSKVVANAGLVETTSTGGLQINSNFTNNGSLLAAGAGALTISGATVTGNGTISTTVASAHIDLVNANIVFGGTISIVAGSNIVAGSKINTLAATLNRLDAHNFNNAGSILIADNSALQMGGVVNNTGIVAINAGADATALEIDSGYLRLTGGGQVTLADSLQSFIVSNGSAGTLDNSGNTISGAGTIGDGNIRLVNRSGSLINANGTHALVINGSTGSTPNFNVGTIETTGSGGLTITGALLSTGTLTAAGSGTLLLSGADVSNGIVQATASGASINLQNANLNFARVTTVAGSTLTALTSTVDSIGNNTVGNAGAVVVQDKATLHVANGYFNNSGSISINASTGATKNVISGYERFLGNGTVTLTDNVNNSIVSDGAAAVLWNIGNTISGAGTIGDGHLQLMNQSGAINANGANALVIAANNDPNVVDTNNGFIETTGAGGLKIFAALQNDGTLEAAGSGGLLVANFINNGGTVAASASGAHIDLQNGFIAGNTLSTVAGSMIDTITGTTDTIEVADFENAGSLVVNDKSFLDLGSYVVNTGTIQLKALTGVTTLGIDAFGTALFSGGALTMSDNVNNRIVANGAITNATTTATIGGTEKNGDILSFTFMNASLPGLPITVSYTTSGSQTLAAVAAGLAAAINANVALQSVNIQASVLGAVITIQEPGDVGNRTSVSSSLSSGATETVTFGSAGGQLLGGTSPTLYNADNTISGAGTIGDATLLLYNGVDGVINANGTKALVINSASHDDFNAGLMETTNTGGLTIIGTLGNTGSLITTKGGLLLKSALINNGGGSIAATVSAAHIDLNNATISSGDVSTVVGGKIMTIAATTDVLDAATSNAGVISVTNNSTLIMGDIINNTGTISMAGAANATTLKVNADGLFLQGHGRLTLTNAATNVIKSNGAPALLRNYDNLIAGGGTIGDANLTLQNQAGGIIDANGTVALTINTGANVVANAGTLESAAAGGLAITGALANDGILLAAAGTLKVTGAVTGNGVTKISGAGIVEFGGASNQNVSFAAGSTGTLRLDTSATSAYSGTVSGLTTTNALDFSDITFSSGTTVATFSGTSTHGVLTVTDGSHVTNVKLKGNFLSSTFTTFSDGHGGTKVVDPPAGSPHAMAAASIARPAVDRFVLAPSMLAASFDGLAGHDGAATFASALTDFVQAIGDRHAGVVHEPMTGTSPGQFGADSLVSLASGKGAFAFHG